MVQGAAMTFAASRPDPVASRCPRTRGADGDFPTGAGGVRAEWQESRKTLQGLYRIAATTVGRRWQSRWGQSRRGQSRPRLLRLDLGDLHVVGPLGSLLA